MDGADLRKTLELLEKKIDNTLHQISEMIEQSNSIPKQFEDPQKLKKITQHGEEVFKDPAVRENTRAKLQDLLDKAKGAKGR
jgi:arsenate reductase-like glutaredoxin family protein